jgi:hypothetical protein
MSREDEADPGSSRDIRISAVREALKLLVDVVKVVEVLATLLARLL